MKQESSLLVGKLLLRGGRYADAEKRLTNLAASLPRDDPQALFVRAYLAESRLGQNNLGDVPKELTAVIRASADGRLRGVAYNLLGDYHRRRGEAEEALWQYLWVDVVYNQDPQQVSNAVDRLADLFKELKDDARAEQYRRKSRGR